MGGLWEAAGDHSLNWQCFIKDKGSRMSCLSPVKVGVMVKDACVLEVLMYDVTN